MISLNHMGTFMCCDIFKNLRRCANQTPAIGNMPFAISRDTTAPTAFRIPHRNFSDPFIQLRRIMMAGRFQFSPRFPNKKASHPTGETLKIRTRDDDFTANPIHTRPSTTRWVFQLEILSLEQNLFTRNERLRRRQGLQLNINPIALLPRKFMRLRKGSQTRNDDMNFTRPGLDL